MSVPRGSIELCGYANRYRFAIGGQSSLYRSSGWSDRSGLYGEYRRHSTHCPSQELCMQAAFPASTSS